MKGVVSNVEFLFEQMSKELKARGDRFLKGTNCVVTFQIDDDVWTLELTEDAARLVRGASDVEPDLELQTSEADFAKLVMGQLTPQTAFLQGKLKLNGDISIASKLQPILAAARPKAKL